MSHLPEDKKEEFDKCLEKGIKFFAQKIRILINLKTLLQLKLAQKINVLKLIN